ncbi:MAG: hypothetical protein ABR515_05820 [Nitrososphaeraceae archaeon]
MTGDTFEKIKKGIKETAEGVKEGVEETAEGVKEGVEDVKEGVEETGEDVKEGAQEVTDSDTYVDTKDESEVTENEADGKEPMNPDDISEHEPTAVKRDQNQGTSGDAV